MNFVTLLENDTIIPVRNIFNNERYLKMRLYKIFEIYDLMYEFEYKFPLLFPRGFEAYKPYATDCAIKEKYNDTVIDGIIHKGYTTLEKDLFLPCVHISTKNITRCFCFTEEEEKYELENYSIPCIGVNYNGLTLREIVRLKNSYVTMPKNVMNFLDEKNVKYTTMKKLLKHTSKDSYLMYNRRYVKTSIRSYPDFFREPFTEEWKRR